MNLLAQSGAVWERPHMLFSAFHTDPLEQLDMHPRPNTVCSKKESLVVTHKNAPKLVNTPD